MSDATKTGDPGRDAAEGLRRAGREARAEAGAAASEARREAEGAVEDVKAEAAGVVEAAKERAMDLAEEQRQAGAERAEDIAGAVHRAADQLKDASPQIAHYVHEAASSLEGVARALRERSPGELMGQVEEFARRQPVAFFGAAVLAGFALARFARSSARHAAPAPGGEGRGRPAPAAASIATPRPAAMGAPGWVPEPGRRSDDAIPPARPATVAAASLGGAAAHAPKPGEAAKPMVQDQSGPRGEIA